MKMVMEDDDYHTSRIETLPFINLDPSNPSTIYTAMCFAQEQIEKHGLKVCPVTFDSLCIRRHQRLLLLQTIG